MTGDGGVLYRKRGTLSGVFPGVNKNQAAFREDKEVPQKSPEVILISPDPAQPLQQKKWRQLFRTKAPDQEKEELTLDNTDIDPMEDNTRDTPFAARPQDLRLPRPNLPQPPSKTGNDVFELKPSTLARALRSQRVKEKDSSTASDSVASLATRLRARRKDSQENSRASARSDVSNGIAGALRAHRYRSTFRERVVGAKQHGKKGDDQKKEKGDDQEKEESPELELLISPQAPRLEPSPSPEAEKQEFNIHSKLDQAVSNRLAQLTLFGSQECDLSESEQEKESSNSLDELTLEIEDSAEFLMNMSFNCCKTKASSPRKRREPDFMTLLQRSPSLDSCASSINKLRSSETLFVKMKTAIFGQSAKSMRWRSKRTYRIQKNWFLHERTPSEAGLEDRR